MQDKTAKAQNVLRSQTFGVEIECYNISREKAAQVAAGYFGTNNYRYTGNTDHYRCWSAFDAQGRKWKFESDSSIDAASDDEQTEVVTPVLRYNDIELLQGLVRVLRKAGAKSDPGAGCGVHIHVGLKSDDGLNHTPATLRNLANLMNSHQYQLVKAIGVDQARLGRWCKVVEQSFLERLNREKPQTWEALADIWYPENGDNWNRAAHYNYTRYHMLNYHACFTKGTIEFRCFQFARPAEGKQNGLHAGQLKAYIQLCLAMSAMAKLQKNCSPKPQQTENEAYAFRCWMLRLGFIGDEFKTAREILMKNMEGNCAWRQAG